MGRLGIHVAVLAVLAGGLLAPAPAAEHTVTLITGDRVTVAERRNRWGLVRIEPADRLRAIGFFQHVSSAGVTVIPTVAAPLVRSAAGLRADRGCRAQEPSRHAVRPVDGYQDLA